MSHPVQAPRALSHPPFSVALLTCALVACTAAGDGARAPTSEAVRPGIDVLLSDSLDLVRGRRVGLVTNHTGRTADGRHDIDALDASPDVELVALFAPEHGLRGTEVGGVTVTSAVDSATGVPVHSLYGDTRKPTPEMLDGVDVLLFDIQDVGARYYTYPSTMALAMEAAGEAGIPFVVLDRPDPIRGDAVQGNVLDTAYSTFVGRYPVPMRHGMTMGELARMFVGEFGVEVDLHVVPVAGWRRDMAYGETGLPWVPPSPNIPTVESALTYPGTCLFEGTPISVGRGTEHAFEWVGAPWLDAPALAEAMEGYGFSGVRFEPVTFTPHGADDGKFDDTEVHGVRVLGTATDFDAPRVGIALLLETRRMSGERWSWRTSHFDRLSGTDAVRRGIEAGLDLAEITADWDAQDAAFEARRAPYLLYPGPASRPAEPPPTPPEELAALWDTLVVPGLEDRTFDHDTYWRVMEPWLGGAVTSEELGRSAEGRDIRHLTYGSGPVTVLLWSQMHGDESTASMALVDIVRFFHDRPGHPLAQRVAKGATIHLVPMLNPDGAQRFRRRNAQGIDVNRDARRLQTPEGRLLERIVDRLRPDFGFNLHDQNAAVRVGDSDRGVAIALLAPAFNEARDVDDKRRKAMRVASLLVDQMDPFVHGHIAKYDDTFNPRAFGDLIGQWGASTVLIESGAWAGDPQKQYLRKVNFVGILEALDGIATGRYAGYGTDLYDSLKYNGRRVPDLLVTGGTIAVPGLPELQADLLVSYGQPLLKQDGVIADIGDLGGSEAQDTLDVSGLYLIPMPEARDDLGGIDTGLPARFIVAEDAAGRRVRFRFEGGPPDPPSP